jgi:hypothetical protein
VTARTGHRGTDLERDHPEHDQDQTADLQTGQALAEEIVLSSATSATPAAPDPVARAQRGLRDAPYARR